MRHFLRYFFVLSAFVTSLSLMAQTTQWRDIYKAKKKDTIYGIAQKYNITLDELKEANPEMKKEDYQLKKGDFVFIPFEKTKADVEAEKNKPA
ncbi:MAG: LysM peptidoglycan-binding domain-containing protein, partial [Prevotella sp.]|nr:LysM peptidoglycan-binding domain-containing protein [Prevotella sp.]